MIAMLSSFPLYHPHSIMGPLGLEFWITKIQSEKEQ